MHIGPCWKGKGSSKYGIPISRRPCDVRRCRLPHFPDLLRLTWLGAGRSLFRLVPHSSPHSSLPSLLTMPLRTYLPTGLPCLSRFNSPLMPYAPAVTKPSTPTLPAPLAIYRPLSLLPVVVTSLFPRCCRPLSFGPIVLYYQASSVSFHPFSRNHRRSLLGGASADNTLSKRRVVPFPQAAR